LFFKLNTRIVIYSNCEDFFLFFIVEWFLFQLVVNTWVFIPCYSHRLFLGCCIVETWFVHLLNLLIRGWFSLILIIIICFFTLNLILDYNIFIATFIFILLTWNLVWSLWEWLIKQITKFFSSFILDFIASFNFSIFLLELISLICQLT
jgi:hypothetical protein